jgi:hypothetical protein
MIAGSTICALGDAAAMPVESFLLHYKSEFLKYIKYVSEQEEEILRASYENNKNEFPLFKK